MACFDFAGGSLPLGGKKYIMGILNYTPDSFSDGGKYYSADSAVERALLLQRLGADIIDIGAASTRPGGKIADENEELRRLKEVVPAVAGSVTVPVSVDTFSPVCAEYALNEGAGIINDVSGILSPDMAEIIRRSGAGWIIMHGGVGVAPSGSETVFADGIINSVQAFFDGAVCFAESNGIPRSRICLDPGFGFAKSAKDNIELLSGLGLLDTHGCAMLAALSRKRFLSLYGGVHTAERDIETFAACREAFRRGADIVRVHTVDKGELIAE